MNVEIVKNGKNNGYSYRFLALLKSYVFGISGTFFDKKSIFRQKNGNISKNHEGI